MSFLKPKAEVPAAAMPPPPPAPTPEAAAPPSYGAQPIAQQTPASKSKKKSTGVAQTVAGLAPTVGELGQKTLIGQ